ncbi:endolytic transglycosylase MltG [Parahaliea aestuarii]|uniref:endolytic transglycosylase MltG n=1 Tax=Parahaliea aestuarii TaxID=1852021 RepID=UPI0016502D92|nr:endolytic transglycosylase MltG [Parahaliea aestuarii]
MLKTLLLLFVVPVCLFVLWFGWNLGAYNSADHAVQPVTVYPGASDKAIALLLYRRGLLNSSVAYGLYLRLTGSRGQMQAGTYEITPAMTVAEISGKFRRGDVVTSVLTILPSQRLSQIRERFLAAGFSPGQVAAALDPASHAGHPALQFKPAGANLEGYLQPESFQYTSATPLDRIVKASLDLTADIFSTGLRQAIEAQGLTLHQAVILASIVEQEVHKPEDRRQVAQVFLTRLKAGMPLGSDVTAYYGASLQGLEEAVSVDTPYNTRMHRGLPPGPISTISQGSLQAVAYPATTDYLYFVTGDDGTTHFSRSAAEHERLREQYCQVLCQLR